MRIFNAYVKRCAPTAHLVSVKHSQVGGVRVTAVKGSHLVKHALRRRLKWPCACTPFPPRTLPLLTVLLLPAQARPRHTHMCTHYTAHTLVGLAVCSWPGNGSWHEYMHAHGTQPAPQAHTRRQGRGTRMHASPARSCATATNCLNSFDSPCVSLTHTCTLARTKTC